MNYDHNKKFVLLKFHSGYDKFNLNSPKGYSLKIINAQTVVKSTHGWFSDVLPVSGLQDRSDESLDPAHLAHDHLVTHVVAREVGQDAGGTRHHVDVV